jgi:nitrogen fixation NifU-like protein
MPDQELYQEFIIELFRNPLNYGSIPDADYKAEMYNTACGDRVVIYLKVKDGKIVDAKHDGKGCAISQASASLFTEHIRGMALEDVKKLGKDDVLGLLKIDLSRNPTRIRCALLPLDAFKRAVKNPEPDR